MNTCAGPCRRRSRAGPGSLESSARDRKSRPLTRKRLPRRAGDPKLDSAAAFHRDTAADSFAAPHRHAGDRRFRFSPKLLALGASMLVFAVFAMGYTGSRRSPQDAEAQPPAIAEGSAVAVSHSTDEDESQAGAGGVNGLATLLTAGPAGEGATAQLVTATVGEGTSSADPDEPEETVFIKEARLLAAASRPDPSRAGEPPMAPAEPVAAPQESAAFSGFTSHKPFLLPRRPWEFTSTPESDLALNDLNHHIAPWSFEVGAPRVGENALASLTRKPPLDKVPEKTVPAAEPLSVMILGDSLALCGFGSRLDQRFRSSANVRSTNTYMACGTVPLSWLKEAPYGNLKTYCGFWSIENPDSDGGKPVKLQDTYGMTKGSKPKPHSVPKLEDLFARSAPDVLILQTGTNLFSLFRDAKTVQPEHNGPMIRNQIQPFLAKILKLPNPPRAIYWVASPTSGRVSPEIQDFVIQQITNLTGPMAKIIDSRQLVTFPYKHMEPDKEHFIGADMDSWADKVYDIVQKDLAAHPLPVAIARPPNLPLDKLASTAVAHHAIAVANDAAALHLTAKLVGKSKPIPLEELRPYNESMVSFVYEVEKVTQGEYAESKIVVMHPAHIGRKVQPLDKLRVGKEYNLTVHELEGSPWNKEKSRDDFGLIELPLFIQVEDEAKFPAHDP